MRRLGELRVWIPGVIYLASLVIAFFTPSYEWVVGAGAGTTIFGYILVDTVVRRRRENRAKGASRAAP